MNRFFIAVALLATACTTSPEGTAPLPDPDTLLFARLDRDGSGRVTADELQDLHADAVVAAWDIDGSGDLDPTEVAAAASGPPPDQARGRGKGKGKGRKAKGGAGR